MSFVWITECEQAFQKLKDWVCEDLILCHFNPNKQYFIETDSFDYVNAGVLLQMGENSLLYPVVYFSRRMTPAECHYKIYDKKLLAII